MTSRAIILCQGDQGRLWQTLKKPKQLVPFRGTTILRRTISQIRSQGVKDIILVAEKKFPWTEFAKTAEVELISELRKVDQDFLDVLVNLRHLWAEDGPTVFVYGDVIFSNRMLADLFAERDNQIHFSTRFSRAYATGVWRAEIFGFRMLPTFFRELEGFLDHRQCSPYHRATDIWDLFHWLMDKREKDKPDEPSFLDAGEEDYTIDIDYPGDIDNLSTLEMVAKDDDAEAVKQNTSQPPKRHHSLKTAISVVTCERSGGVRYVDDTLKNLEEEGALECHERYLIINDSDLSVDAPSWMSFRKPNPRGIRFAMWETFAIAQARGVDQLIFCEDDIRTCKNAIRYIMSLEVPPQSAFIDFYDVHERHRNLAEPGMHLIAASDQYWGNLCMLIPRQTIDYLLKRDPADVQRQWFPNGADNVLGHFISESPTPHYALHLPRLVRHMGETSAAHQDTPRLDSLTIVSAPKDFDALSLPGR